MTSNDLSLQLSGMKVEDQYGRNNTLSVSQAFFQTMLGEIVYTMESVLDSRSIFSLSTKDLFYVIPLDEGVSLANCYTIFHICRCLFLVEFSNNKHVFIRQISVCQ